MSDLNVLLQEAQSESTAPERLRELAAKENPAEVRQACAVNPMTPLEVLNDLAAEFPSAFLANPTTQLRFLDMEELLGELSEKSRRALAGCVESPGFLLQMLAENEEWLVRAAVAEHPNCSPELLDRLVMDEEWLVRAAVAKNPNCSPVLLDRLAADKESIVRAAVAKNPNCHPALLDRLAVDEDEDVRAAVAEHPNCSPELLDRLAMDEEWFVRTAVAEKPNCSPELLDRLAADKESIVRAAVAQNSNCFPELLDRLAGDEDSDVRAAVAQNLNYPPALLDRLAVDEYEDVRKAVAKNPNCSPVLLDGLAVDEDLDVREAVAKNPNCSPVLLDRLAVDEDNYVRQAVAENPNCSPELLDRLAADKNRDVRKAVASNSNCSPELQEELADQEWSSQVSEPSCSPEILSRLAGYKNWEVRVAVAQNPNCSSEILNRLAEDEDLEARVAVAQNPNCSPERLDRLAEDEDLEVRAAVAQNPNCSPEILNRLAEDKESIVRAAVAKNSNCSTEILEKLSQDEYYSQVREAVARNPRCSSEILNKLANDKFFSVRHNIALLPSCPPVILTKLSDDKDHRIRLTVVQNLNCSPEILAKLAEDTNADVRLAIAEKTNCPPGILTKLAEGENAVVQQTPKHGSFAHKDKSIYWAIASNRNVSLSTLEKLYNYSLMLYDSRCNDRKVLLKIQEAIANNPVTSAEILLDLALQYLEYDELLKEISGQAFEHANMPLKKEWATWEEWQEYCFCWRLSGDVPVEILWQMSQLDWVCRQAVATAPHVPEELIELLAEDEDEDVAFDVARGCRFQDLLIRLSESPDPDIRVGVTWNPSCPVSVLEKLWEDEEIKWGTDNNCLAGFSRNPNCSLKILQELALSYLYKDVLLHPNSTPEVREIASLMGRLYDSQKEQSYTDIVLIIDHLEILVDSLESYFYFQRGEAHAALGNWELAARDYAHLLELNPDAEEQQAAYQGLGQYRCRTGDFEGAVAAYSALIEISSTAVGYLNRAMALTQLNRWSEAVTDLQMVLEKAPEDVRALAGLTLAYRHLNQLEQAQIYGAQLQALLPSDDPLIGFREQCPDSWTGPIQEALQQLLLEQLQA